MELFSTVSNVLVDTSVWSLALRRRKRDELPAEGESALIKSLEMLITEGRAVIIGPVRQEILSGIASMAQYRKLREFLRPFEDIPLLSGDYERAAELFNLCRLKGIQGSHVDFLICAAAERHKFAILTNDNDFVLYSRHIAVHLYVPGTG